MSCPVCNQEKSNEIGIKNNFNIVSCPSCSCVYVSPVPSLEQLASIYDDYEKTDEYMKKLKKKIFTSTYKLKRLKKFVINKGHNFLDVGCNIGATVKAAQKSGYSAMGIDLDEISINIAKNLFDDCEFKACSSFDLVNTGRNFNFIYCSEVIEHVPFPNKFVQSLADLLVTDGLLYLTTPDIGHRKIPNDILSWKMIKPPEHIIFFNKKSMSYLLKEHGFEIIKFYWSHRANLRVVCRKVS